MTYLTYGPSPTSLYRVVTSPADAPLASPLDPERTPLLGARRVARAALRISAIAGLALAAAAAAMGLRLAAYAAGYGVGLL